MQTYGNVITVKEALEKGIAILKKSDIKTPALEAGVMLCNALKCDKAFLYSRNENTMTYESSCIFFDSLEKRISGIPLQYITGRQEFMSLTFEVSPNVLIPRQDTEILVETVIRYAGLLKTGNIRILDIGTGSGCIAVCLAYYIKNCTITALDISKEALDIARRNAENAGVENRICFIQSNLFSRLSSHHGIDNIHCFDIIVSNPPYIKTEDMEKLQTEIKCHEPHVALCGGYDGLNFYRSIIKKSPQFLSREGLLALEVGYNQAADVTGLMEDRFFDISVLKDLSNIERVVTGRLKSQAV